MGYASPMSSYAILTATNPLQYTPSIFLTWITMKTTIKISLENIADRWHTRTLAMHTTTRSKQNFPDYHKETLFKKVKIKTEEQITERTINKNNKANSINRIKKENPNFRKLKQRPFCMPDQEVMFVKFLFSLF